MKRRVNLKSYELRKLKSNSDEPAAAVIRRVRALSGFTGRKGLRRRFIKSKLKSPRLTGKPVLILINFESWRGNWNLQWSGEMR